MYVIIFVYIQLSDDLQHTLDFNVYTRISFKRKVHTLWCHFNR